MKNEMKLTGLAIAMSAAAMLAPLTASAQTLVVDTEKVFKTSEAGKSGQAKMEGRYTTRETSVRSALTAAANAWNEQVKAAQAVAKPNTPLPAANTTALQKARGTLDEATNAAQELQQEEQTVDQYIRSQIVKVMIPVAEKIRADRRANLVVPVQTVLAFDPANDVTDLVIKGVNDSLKTVSIDLPQQQPQAAAPAAPATAPAQNKQQPQTR